MSTFYLVAAWIMLGCLIIGRKLIRRYERRIENWQQVARFNHETIKRLEREYQEVAQSLEKARDLNIRQSHTISDLIRERDAAVRACRVYRRAEAPL